MSIMIVAHLHQELNDVVGGAFLQTPESRGWGGIVVGGERSFVTKVERERDEMEEERDRAWGEREREI